MDFSDAFRLVNLGVGGLMTFGGVWHIISPSFMFGHLIVGIYGILFGLAVLLLVYIFCGSILIGDGTINNIIGGAIALVGVAYAVLEFIPSIEPPQNMREADGGWGAEQV
ncbi:hypothetical protein M7I_5489 [Glarea lozoyensis 74030]|uniref:Uncharacterized protein n=1 Tax=Glarea lozoyensis (strain ATCC 74030 / MF5533) TaxID=1104152 RepID=H0ES15_GLAL7|nr:hypothetical protein M7I_5489 [Glarea lozoyensis 74030]